MNTFLKQTDLLDFKHQTIQKLIDARDWKAMGKARRIKAIYNFVRDEIQFGYNETDSLKASHILQDGYGQCNTKATLLMALLRAVNIPCRIHGFTIFKALQKGAINGIWYRLSPKNILHSWVEVQLEDEWYFLEGVILDQSYLRALQTEFVDCQDSFCGFGVYTQAFQSPQVDWNFNHTYIQHEGINQDFGVFDSPDDLYAKHSQKLGWFKEGIFKILVRHLMNRNVNRIRRKLTRYEEEESLPVEELA